MLKLKLYAQNMTMNKFFKCVQLIKYKCKDNKYNRVGIEKANTMICYRGSVNCLRPRSKYNDLEIPL